MAGRWRLTSRRIHKGIRIMNKVVFVHMGIISAVKRVKFVSDIISYIILRGRRCHIIVLNVHARTEMSRRWNAGQNGNIKIAKQIV
jgi:hypothetical protein